MACITTAPPTPLPVPHRPRMSFMDFLRDDQLSQIALDQANSRASISRQNTILTSENPRLCARNKKIRLVLRTIIAIILLPLEMALFLTDWYIKRDYAKHIEERVRYTFSIYIALQVIYLIQMCFYAACNPAIRSFIKRHVLKKRVAPAPNNQQDRLSHHSNSIETNC